MSAAATTATSFFLPYQKRWIKDRSRLKLMRKSRQTGISWSEAYSKSRLLSTKNHPFDAWISSRDDIQARLFLNDCKDWAQLLQVGARDVGELVFDQEKDLRAHTLLFANGRTINSMSSNPNAQAGKRGHRTLDEFALHKDQEQLYAIAQPGLMWGGTMSIISTHRGSHSFFNHLIKEIEEKGNPKGFSLHTVTIEDAVREGLLERIQAKVPEDDPRKFMSRDEFLQAIRDECADQESWDQEYMCIPADDAAAFLEYYLITQAEFAIDHGGWTHEEVPYVGSPKNGQLSIWEGVPLTDCGELYLGFDVARTKDFSVIWVAEKFGDILWARKIVRMRSVKFSDQRRHLWELLSLPNLRRGCIDKSGLGMELAEDAECDFRGRAEGVQFSVSVKEAMAMPLKGRMQDGGWKIPDDKIIRADLRAVRKETTTAGNTRFVAEAGDDGHADHFWAMALCQHAAENVVEAGRFLRTRSRKPMGRTRARRRRSVA